MSEGYGSHADYMAWISDEVEARQATLYQDLKDAFVEHIEMRSVEVVVFSSMGVIDFANAIERFPSILKSLLAACNLAARAIERDLQIKNVDTFKPRLTRDQIVAIAGYARPFLPDYLELPVLVHLDRTAFIDKEIRKAKGQWEKRILNALNMYSDQPFKKRLFKVAGESFELDAASPPEGAVRIGIDVKRIEARRDIHKRCDEIVNKAAKLKSVYANAKFAAVIYYPFVDEHINVQNRLKSDNIDDVAFASEAPDSVENAARMLLSSLGVGT